MNALTYKSLSLHFNPLIPESMIYILAAVSALLIALSFWQSRRLSYLRIATFIAFILVLINPTFLEERREPVTNIAAVIVDDSASQSFQNRQEITQKALEAVRSAYDRSGNIELRIANAPVEGRIASRTDLFASLNTIFQDVPEQRRAGVIFITDGLVHDMPDLQTLKETYGPVHVLLTGKKNEKDRRITIVDAPAFGIVGQSVSIKFRIDDSGHIRAPDARVTIKMAGQPPETLFVEPGADQTIELPVVHAGQNVFELSTEMLEGELTTVNNRVALNFQGVRDRMKVLLVSGRPHAGGRTWRDLLTSDPSVDLVHFTILRDPDKIDGTPPSEMSLIAFPFKELFEIKLYDFDLIVFDRYSLNRILPDFYFENIARYVREGGAFLEASGPDYATQDSLYYTALRDILPGSPTGSVDNEIFTPMISAKGKTHPVTRNLTWKTPEGSEAQWGPWMHQVGLSPLPNSDVLMTGNKGAPLLLLNRVDEGRVAHIASDHIWMWARGYKGGGPHAELLRRVVHWLLKEPELDEQALDIRVDGHAITIRRPSYQRQEETLLLRKPDGAQEDIILKDAGNGYIEHHMQVDQIGIYEFASADGQNRFAIVGEADPPEFRDVLTNDKIMKPLSNQSGGGIFWIQDNGMPSFKTVIGESRAAGQNWLGLRNNQSYSIAGALEKPLLPLWISLLLLAALMTLTWWHEGRNR